MSNTLLAALAENIAAQEKLLKAISEELSGEKLITVKEYSERYKMHPDTIRNQLRLGILSGIKVSERKWLIKVRD